MNEVVWPKKCSDTASSDAVHCPRLQVNEKGSGHIFTPCKQDGNMHCSVQLLNETHKTQEIFITMCLIEVDVDPLQL